MGNKPILTSKWRKWLQLRGLVYKRIHASHEIWDFPGDSSLLRPIVFRHSEKEIPGFHIQTNLRTLGVDYDTFKKELENI